MGDQEPQSFSVASAEMAVNEMFEALTKPRRMQYIGHLNEVVVVLQRLASMAGVEDVTKTL